MTHNPNNNHRKIFLLLHGYQGDASDMHAYARILEREGYETILTSFNENSIQEWGKKVLRDVDGFFQREGWTMRQEKSHQLNPAQELEFSIMAHSLGGIIARYILPSLNTYLSSSLRPHIHVTFKNFITIASPHLGIQREDASIKKGLWKWAIEFFAWSNLGGRIPAQLLLKEEKLNDQDIADTNQAQILLLQMCFGKYIEALQQYKEHLLVALAHHDFAVPFPSASIRAYNPYKLEELDEFKFEIVGCSGFDEEELTQWWGHWQKTTKQGEPEASTSNIITTTTAVTATSSPSLPFDESLADHELRHLETFINDSGDHHEWVHDNYLHLRIHRTMLKQLQTLPWKRLDVRFHAGLVSRFAMPHHNMLVAKSLPVNLVQTAERVALMKDCTETVCGIILRKVNEDEREGGDI